MCGRRWKSATAAVTSFCTETNSSSGSFAKPRRNIRLDPCYPRLNFIPSELRKTVLNRPKLASALLIFVLGVAAGYLFAAHHFRGGASIASAPQTVGPWQAIFKVPASFRVPMDNPVLVFDFRRDEPDVDGAKLYQQLSLTARNLGTRSLTVQLQVYGYDSMNFRQSGAIDRFSIQPGEKLTRKLKLETYLGGNSLGLPASQAASSFALAVKVEE